MNGDLKSGSWAQCAIKVRGSLSWGRGPGEGERIDFLQKLLLAKVGAEQIRPLARNEIHQARPFALADH